MGAIVGFSTLDLACRPMLLRGVLPNVVAKKQSKTWRKNRSEAVVARVNLHLRVEPYSDEIAELGPRIMVVDVKFRV